MELFCRSGRQTYERIALLLVLSAALHIYLVTVVSPFATRWHGHTSRMPLEVTLETRSADRRLPVIPIPHTSPRAMQVPAHHGIDHTAVPGPEEALGTKNARPDLSYQSLFPADVIREIARLRQDGAGIRRMSQFDTPLPGGNPSGTEASHGTIESYRLANGTTKIRYALGDGRYRCFYLRHPNPLDEFNRGAVYGGSC